MLVLGREVPCVAIGRPPSTTPGFRLPSEDAFAGRQRKRLAHRLPFRHGAADGDESRSRKRGFLDDCPLCFSRYPHESALPLSERTVARLFLEAFCILAAWEHPSHM